MKQFVHIYKGLPASGKTTAALDVVRNSDGKTKRINKDDLRAMIDGGRFSKGREEEVLRVRDSLLLQFLKGGYNVIIDDTNLHPKHEALIRETVEMWCPDVEVWVDDTFLKTPMKVCIERDSKRANPVGRDVIRRMAREAGLLDVVPYPYDPTLPDCVICDLDGTLALMGKRNPYDASKCIDDKLNDVVAQLVRHFHSMGMTIFYFSGRSEEYREQTCRWLQVHDLDLEETLAMRPAGDNRKDCIVKREMFEKHVRGQYNVHCVFDDRNQVVELWRELGLTCFQVADGDF